MGLLFRILLISLLLQGAARAQSFPFAFWGADTTAPSSDADSIRPAMPITLATMATGPGLATLQVTSVGDDSLTGQATTYDLRYSTVAFTSDEVVWNQHFEVDTSGWNPHNCTISRTDTAHTGSHALVFTATYEWGAALFQCPRPGTDTAFVSAWVYLPGETDTVSITLVDEAFGQFKTQKAVVVSADTWTQLRDTMKLDGGQTVVQLAVQLNNAATARRMFVDDVSMRFSGATWASGTGVAGEKTPSVSGSIDTLLISGLAYSTRYYAALRVLDEESNVSRISNLVTFLTQGEDGPTQDTSTSGTYYLATTGDNGNPGTLAQPWQTLSYANPRLRAGDTLTIRDGTYLDVIEPDSSGDAVRGHITYMGYGTEVPIIRGKNENNFGTVGLGWSTSGGYQTGRGNKFIRLQNLNIQTVNENEVASNCLVYVFGTDTGAAQRAENIVLKRVRITASGNGRSRYLAGLHQSGIHIGYARSVSILNSRIENMYHGIWTDKNKKPNLFLFQHDTLISIQDMSFVIGGDKAGAWGDTLSDSQIAILDNYADTSWTEDHLQMQEDYEWGAHPWEEHLSGVHRGILVRGNTFLNAAEQSGIDAKACDGVIFEFNVMAHGHGDNDGFEGVDKLDAPFTISSPHQAFPQDAYSKHNINRFNILFDNNGGITTRGGWQNYNNTVVNNRFDYRGSNQTDHPLWYAGGLVENDQENVLWGASRKGMMINTIFVNNRANLYASHSSDSNHIDYNLYFDEGGGAMNVYRHYPNPEQVTTTKAAWIAGLGAAYYSNTTGDDSNSVYANPLFETSPTLATLAGTLHGFVLSASSPAVGAACPLMTTLNSGTNSTSMVVSRPLALFAGLSGPFAGLPGLSIPGDSIKVGDNAPVRVTWIDRGSGQMRHTTGTIAISTPISWTPGTPIRLWRNGRVVDDIGAVQR